MKTTKARRARGEGRPLAATFGARLSDWLHANKRDRVAGKPHNANQLAATITSLGERCWPATIGRWIDGEYLPESRYVALLEPLIGVPWCLLVDRREAFPPSPEDQELHRLVFSAPNDRARARVRAAIRDALR